MTHLSRSMGKLIKLFYSRYGHIERDCVDLAVNCIENGGIIALPTDTIYGIAAKADDTSALQRIFEVKGRDQAKPLAVCVSKVDDIKSIAQIDDLNPQVLPSLLPGPVTVLLQRSPSLNRELNPGIETVGVRVPNHNFIMALSHMVGPLALTSANKSGKPSPLIVEDFQDIWPQLDYIFDNGITRGSIDYCGPSQSAFDSTVVDLTKPKVYKIVREGCSLNRTINVLNRFGFRRDIPRP